ncbi:hypothetical protein AAG906_017172 [Vitis piasezkii]
MCGGDDHLTWKCPVSSEACRYFHYCRSIDTFDLGSAITSHGQRMDGQQAQQVLVQESVQYDPTIPPPFPPSQIAPQDTQIPPPPPLGQSDAYARMDRLEQRMRLLRVSDGGMVWDDFDGLPVANLPSKFKMPKIERYKGLDAPSFI